MESVPSISVSLIEPAVRSLGSDIAGLAWLLEKFGSTSRCLGTRRHVCRRVRWPHFSISSS